MGDPLNPAQRAAVEHGVGPALVLAGAGSGKTRVITQRIERLVDGGVLPRTIAAVTFTNKAAEEMQERLAQRLGARARELWVSTFHALGGEIVRREMPRGERFVIYDAADTAGLVKELLRETKVPDRRFDAGAIVARISHAKNAMTTPDALPETGPYDEIARWVYPRYEAALRRLHALDFDDLILWPLRRLTDDAAARERWRQRARFLLVDEFQDTNRAQLLLVKALAGEGGNVFCVGDDDQAIYGWRGADIANVVDFPVHFPGARVLALEQNYRSCAPVLAVANAVMEGVPRAFPKRLFTDRPGGERVRVVECDSGEGEARFVVETTQKLLGEGYARREIGVLYRSNQLARGLEEGFRLAGIPVRLIGGTSVYERREVKDLIAYLRLAVHPGDEIAFRRVVNQPARGVGEASLEKLERWARARGETLFTAARSADAMPELGAAVKESLRGFVAVLRGAREGIARGEGLADVARRVAAAVRLREDIVDAGPTALVAGRRWGNVEALFRTLERAPELARPGSSPDDAAEAFLARLTLRFAEEDEGRDERVTLSTLHGAKGLEFGTVFFVGCDEGIIPHARMDAPRATDVVATLDAGEERRLFYVGVTRAKARLYLVRARVRGARGVVRATAPSRFLQGLPGEMLERVVYDSQAPAAPAELAAQARSFREALAARARK